MVLLHRHAAERADAIGRRHHTGNARHLAALCAHQWRVYRLVDQLAVACSLPEAERRATGLAAVLHDVGKIALPPSLLVKPGPLTDEEWVLMHQHPSHGARILAALGLPDAVVAAVCHHHERWDGTGYPAGLRGTAIPLAARVVAVVDAYDAMTSDRPYRAAVSPEVACCTVAAERGAMFDPVIADAFLALRRVP